MAFDWRSIFGPLFQEEESHGTIGCDIPINFCNLLIQPKKIFLTDTTLGVQFDHICPEGLGWSQFDSDTLQIPEDRVLNEDMVLLWDAQAMLPPMGQLCWVYDVKELFPDEGFQFAFLHTSSWLPLRSKNHQGIHHLELFAGGLGGWSMASQWMQRAWGIPIQTLAIEQDPPTAAAYAMTHSAVLLQSTCNLPVNFLSGANRNVILMMDVLNEEWHPIAAEWAIDCVTISSPCKPFSGASSSKGLLTEDGMLLPKTLVAIRRFRPSVIMIEQVHKFATHSHKIWVVKLLHALGYHIVWQKVLDLQTHMPTHRPRWLAVAVRIHGNWPKVSLSNWGPITYTCLRNTDCIMSFPRRILQQLEITAEIREIASNPRFSKHSAIRVNQTDGIFRARLATEDMPAATFMAMYGSQHKLSQDRLAEYGFFGHYLLHRGSIRHYHPMEVALIHGVLNACYLYDDLEYSWLILGNQISVLQALYPMVIALQGILNEQLDWGQLIQRFHVDRLKASKLHVTNMSKGYLIHHADFPVEDVDIQAEQDLMTWISSMEPKHDAWVPGLGMVGIDDLIKQTQATAAVNSEINASVASPSTATDEVPPTVRYVPVIEHCIRFGEVVSKFWAASDLSNEAISLLWAGQFHIHHDDLLGPTITINAGNSPQHTGMTGVIVVLTSNKLMLLAHDETDLTRHTSLTSIGLPLFDLHGNPLQSTLSHPCNAIVDTLFLSGTFDLGPEFLLAATQQLSTEVRIRMQTDTIEIYARGNSDALRVMELFWSSCLDEQSWAAINRTYHSDRISEHEHVVSFVGKHDLASLPTDRTCFLMSIMATRMLLNKLVVDQGVSITIKFQREVIWTGTLGEETTIQVIMTLLHITLQPMQHGVPLRVVHKGKQCPLENKLHQLDITPHRQSVTLHLVGAMHGGGGTKQQQRTLHKNALASVLIEQGCDVKWTSTAVDTLLQSGLHKIEPITSMGPGQARIQAVLNLCREHGIDLPKMEPPKSQKPLPRPLGKKTKKGDLQLDPQDFQLVPGFFFNQDDTDVSQMTSLRPHTSGLVILSPQQVESWLREGTAISSDELGALVLGPLPTHTALPSNKVTFPCKNASHQDVLLTATLVQFGARHIKVAQGKADQVKEQACALIALTAFKENFAQQSWEQCVTNTYAFFKQRLSEDGLSNCIQTSWGKSLRHQRAAATPQTASSVQIHCTVPLPFVAQLLSQSGFNGIFATPKDRTGRLDSAYKVIWCEGDLPKVTSMSQKTSNCMGLIRGKNSLGL